MQNKVLLFVHDGSGLGHLRRIARIASILQGPCATLIVTGQKDALWLIDDKCEFIYLPGWDTLSATRAEYWDKPLWYDIDIRSAAKLRSELFASIVQSFNPDAIIVDYLPFGKYNEIEQGLRSSNATKYLINRGIVDTSDWDLLCGDATKEWEDVYDRVIVTADNRIVDVVRDCNYGPTLAGKVTYAGYIIPEKIDREKLRLERGIVGNKKWVVCSSGGGIRSEKFLLECIEIAKKNPDVAFDIVFGPRTKINPHEIDICKGNINVRFNYKDLPHLNAACDVAVINGGYNSTMEAISGGGAIIVHPNQLGDNDEQLRNAMKLADHYPISVADDIERLEKEILCQLDKYADRRIDFPLKKDGIDTIKKTVLNDFVKISI